ncbi:MAG: MtrB/PioB family outer membrane beta-barrel protein [Candidatus Binatia bacterium]
MKQTKVWFFGSSSLLLFLFALSSAWGQIDVGDYTISGSGEIGGLPRGFKGDRARFEEYRDIPESIIVPQLQLMIGGKREDYYLYADSYKTGLDDQSYTLRVGRYGLFDIEFQWDQIPHWFDADFARTPYSRSGGHTTVFSLSSKPTATTASTNCATSPTCQWLNTTTQPINLSLYNGIARFKVRYTPTPGWTLTGRYWQNHNVGDRAFGTLFGTSPGSFNITELAEPIDYQTYNIELGGEYATNGWSVGLRYNGSIFNNLRSSIVWDNPMNLTGVGTACQDSATLNYNTGTGACRGRMDLYPNNQAHTVTLSGAARLPYKSNFMGTVSYGVRLQDASFSPFTINSCYGSGPKPASCADATLTPLPTISRSSLSGDVRPLLVNATLVNNFFDRVNLKAFYRYYGLSNHSSQVHLPQGFINLDTGAPTGEPLENELYSYAKNSVGFEAGYNFARWLSAKWSYGYERMHRHDREVFNADEYSTGPTFDIKPTSQLSFRAAYRYLWRNISAYNALPEADASNVSRKFDEAARRRNKASLFASYTPRDNLEFHWGFELTSDRYLYATLGAQRDNNFSPSFGFIYAPLNWLKIFADYNWDRNDWKLNTEDRTSTVTQTPANSCFPAVPIDQNRCWTSRGKDTSNTISFGSDMDLIPNLLGFRIQYTFSNGNSVVSASGDEQSSTPARNYPIIKNQWYELLARFEYKLQQNLALRFGYYFNHATEQDFGVDIMKQWMGDVDVVPTPNANTARSMFLGDRIKGPFTANVGFVTVAFKF